MTTLARPLRVNHMEYARPGMVGSVGDALVTAQLAVSTPGMPIRLDPKFAKRPDNGSIITPQPYVLNAPWTMGRSENTAYGMIQQDLRAPDKLHEPVVSGGNPRYDWYNKVATVYESRVRGEKFLPLPGPYQLSPGEITRGSQVVRSEVIDTNLRSQDPLLSQMFGKLMINIPADKGMVESLVSNRPVPNLVNQTKAFNVAAPHSGMGTSKKYK